MRFGPLALVVAGCGDPPCVGGELPGPEGACFAVAEPFGSLPACELLPVDADEPVLDLESRCAGPGCVGQLPADLEAAYGLATCLPSSDDPATLGCAWPVWGVLAYLADADQDGVPDPDVPSGGLWVGPTFPGATVDGLGAGISVGCFIEAIGVPSAFGRRSDGGPSWVVWYTWSYGEVQVEDEVLASGEPGGDGIVDWVYLTLR